METLRKQFDYHIWRIGAYADHILSLPPDVFDKPVQGSFDTLGKLVLHLEGAERYIYCVATQTPMNGLNKPVGIDAHTVARHWKTMAPRWQAFMEKLTPSDLQKEVGVPRKDGIVPTSLHNALIQAIDHATYHLGQLPYALRQLNQPQQKISTYFAYTFTPHGH